MKISNNLQKALSNIDNLIDLREWYNETKEFDDELEILSNKYGKNPITILFGIVSGKTEVEQLDETKRD